MRVVDAGGVVVGRCAQACWWLRSRSRARCGGRARTLRWACADVADEVVTREAVRVEAGRSPVVAVASGGTVGAAVTYRF